METDVIGTPTTTSQSPAAIYDDDLSTDEQHHPDTRVYVVVAAILAVVTLVEVWTYYIDEVRPYLLPILLVLGAVKFVLVALYFMHLKFDSPIFRRIFVTGVALSIVIFSIVLAAFGLF